MTDDKAGIRLQCWSSQLSIEERLAELTEFIRYWHDAPPGERVVAPAAFPDFLPAPLKWLYKTSAKYDETALRSNYGGWIHGVGVIAFNSLKHPSHLQPDESGYIEFLNEDQGVCQWATLNRPDDPPVFRRWLHEPPWEHHYGAPLGLPADVDRLRINVRRL